MQYAIDYSEKTATGLRWHDSQETPEKFEFIPFFAESEKKEKKKSASEQKEDVKFQEVEFVEGLQPGDALYLEGIGVTDVLSFLASERGATVKRIFPMDIKEAREKLGLTKKDGTARTLYEMAKKSPDLFREYVPIPPELHLLRRWVRMHFRFQKRFRTGLQATLELLGKEVQELLHFGHLKNSHVAKEAETAIEEVLEIAEKLERKFLLEVEHSLRDSPLWTKVLEPIKGIGPRIGGKIVASGPRARFKNRDHFVASAGFHVRNGGAVKREKGKLLKRDNLLYDGVHQFTRRLGCHEGEWTDMYASQKQVYLGRGETMTKFHADLAARRYVGTKLLRRIWREWGAIESAMVK